MKKLLFVALVIYALYDNSEKFGFRTSNLPTIIKPFVKSREPIFKESYVAVYGRKTCGFTNLMIKNLKSSNANYYYFDIDDSSVLNVLQTRMAASGISIEHYYLPVVDVNGTLSIRPEFNSVISKYKEKL